VATLSPQMLSMPPISRTFPRGSALLALTILTCFAVARGSEVGDRVAPTSLGLWEFLNSQILELSGDPVASGLEVGDWVAANSCPVWSAFASLVSQDAEPSEQVSQCGGSGDFVADELQEASQQEHACWY